MKFEPGALVLLLRAKNPLLMHLIGQIYTLAYLDVNYPGSWVLDGVIVSGKCVSWTEGTMRVIGNPDNDATDESLFWLPVPSTHRKTETS